MSDEDAGFAPLLQRLPETLDLLLGISQDLEIVSVPSAKLAVGCHRRFNATDELTRLLVVDEEAGLALNVSARFRGLDPQPDLRRVRECIALYVHAEVLE
jgi:hypothetical protein